MATQTGNILISVVLYNDGYDQTFNSKSGLFGHRKCMFHTGDCEPATTADNRRNNNSPSRFGSRTCLFQLSLSLGVKRCDHVKNRDVAATTGFPSVDEIICKRRNALFDQVTRTPFHQTLNKPGHRPDAELLDARETRLSAERRLN